MDPHASAPGKKGFRPSSRALTHREERLKRQKTGRIVLLSICIVLLLLLLTSIAFLFCHVAFLIRNDPNNPNGTQKVTVESSCFYSGPLAVVNALHPCETTPADLVEVGSTGIRLQKAAAGALEEFLAGFAEQTHGAVTVGAGYRPEDPTSDFSLGYTVRLLRGDGVPVSKKTELWLYQHCWQYGFIYSFENDGTDRAGCFRFVGNPHAYHMMVDLDQPTLEEYTGRLRDNLGNFDGIEINGAVWRVYYVKVDHPEDGGTSSVTLPKYSEISVSGDHVGGVILAVKLPEKE